jgi:hypothetical protein
MQTVMLALACQKHLHRHRRRHTLRLEFRSLPRLRHPHHLHHIRQGTLARRRLRSSVGLRTRAMMGVRRRCGTIRNIMRRRTRGGLSLTDLSWKRALFIFISRCCYLLAIFFFGFSLFLQCCSHRHAFIFYAFPLPLTPYSLPLLPLPLH